VTYPHIVPEQQESEKSAERRRQQLVAERWHVDTGVACIRSSVDMVEPIIQHSLRLQQKQRRDETSQGTWDAWCRAKVHGTADLKAIWRIDRTALTYHPEKKYGKAMEEASSYTAVSTPTV
jgi:hypothetical protein